MKKDKIIVIGQSFDAPENKVSQNKYICEFQVPVSHELVEFVRGLEADQLNRITSNSEEFQKVHDGLLTGLFYWDGGWLYLTTLSLTIRASNK